MTKKTNKSTAKSNTATIATELTRLHNKRSEWEGGVYKRSNEQLYAILAECHTLLVQLRGELKLRKKLNDAIETAGFTVRSNTSLELKVVRAVFGIECKRTQVYVRVLQLAKKDMRTHWTLPEWIEEHGGIEEIRRKPKSGPSAADKAKQYRSLAERQLSNVDNIGKRFVPNNSMQPDESGDFDFSVALVRIDKDGKASIVFGSNKNALVKAVLTEAGKQITDEAENAEVPVKQTNKRNQRDAVLDSDDSDLEADAAIAA